MINATDEIVLIERHLIPALPFCHAILKGPRPPSPSYPQQIDRLGDHIRKRRLDLKLSQKQAAELLAVNPGTITNWEGQHSNPALLCMPAIIRFLGYNPLPEVRTLSGKLARYRLSCGTTQKALAKRLGVDPCTLARWERGDTEPTGLYRKLVEKLLTDSQQDQ
jgi:transcriptional regulator with XRE-family HTH domain